MDSRGLYAPQSLTWQINRHPIILLGGLRALLMQVAHPLVAQGVAEHSSFQKMPLKRLFRTLDLMLTVTFGDLLQAQQAVDAIGQAHLKVKGVLPQTAGPYKQGQAYHAEMLPLKVWVLATLVDTSMRMYDLFVQPLGLGQRKQYYYESFAMSRMLGIPDEAWPCDYDAFEKYMREMEQHGIMAKGTTAKQLGRDIMYPPIAGLPQFLVSPLRMLTLGFLPESLRKDFGFEWRNRNAKIHAAWVIGLRLFYRLWPPVLKTLPYARKAKKRWS